MKKLFRLVFAFVSLFVVACSNAPKVETSPIKADEVKGDSTVQKVEMSGQRDSVVLLDGQSGEKITTDSSSATVQTEIQVGDTADVLTNLLPLPPQTDSLANVPRVDPFEEISRVVLKTFSKSDSLLNANDPEAAVASVERFTVLNPLWESWMKRAEETLQRAKMAASTNARYEISLNAFTGVNDKSEDPYIEIQKVIVNSFAYADYMIASGMPERALAEMESLIAVNASLGVWIMQANQLVERAKEMQQAVVDRRNALVSMIVNENAVSGDYVTVKMLADSLSAIEPGDSLKAFARRQVQIAYAKTLKKAGAEKARILSNAEKSGDFSTADSLANYLVLRYRDFADTLQLKQWRESIHTQAVLNSMDRDYWKTNKPEDVFARAESLLNAGKIAEAKELYLKLTTSSERERALVALGNMAHDVCVLARKEASGFYASALSSKKKEDKQKKLEKALDALNPCLENFADDVEATKAKEDKKLLEQERE